ncbi:MAG: FHA domain-containing protein [Candidatus Omnitrophica bacterium]|nr:FHA domain-containing protein [Candidatus Omnitrophota bacterium]MCM8777862.1 FHA domain-containing protein [Candidatus Omnitrophota bacterium]
MAKLAFNYPFMEREYKLEGRDVFYIGRINTNDITIPDYPLFRKLPPSSQKLLLNDLTKVSRIHAKITKKEDKWYIEDIGTQGLGSNFGTFVNELRLEVKKPYLLQNNDKIRLGTIEFIFIEE